MPPGQQIALEPALTGVLAEDLHHPAVDREVFVGRQDFRVPGLAGHVVQGVQAVRGGLVRPEDAEVRVVGAHHVPQEGAQHPGRFVRSAAGVRHVHRVPRQVRQLQIAGQNPAVRVRIRPHPPIAVGDLVQQPWYRLSVRVEELLGPVAPQPLVQQGQMLRRVPYSGQRHLVGSPGPFDQDSVDFVRPGPALRRTEYDHRPCATRCGRIALGLLLDVADLVENAVEGCGERLVDQFGIVMRRPGTAGNRSPGADR